MDQPYNATMELSCSDLLHTIQTPTQSALPSGMICQPSLLVCCKTKQFDKVAEVLRNEDLDLGQWLDDCSEEQHGQNAMHIILPYNPPRKVLDLLLLRMKQIFPDGNPLLKQDVDGNTPLHVAVARCCHVRLVEWLIRASAIGGHNAASIKDKQGRYPLHLACATLAAVSPRKNSQSGQQSKEHWNRLVACLVAAFPMAADAPDAMGLTPKALVQGCGDRRIAQQLELATKMSLAMTRDDSDVASEEGDVDVVDAIPSNSSKQGKEKLNQAGAGGSHSTEPTTASSLGGRPGDTLHASCYEADSDISSITRNWFDDDDYRFVFFGPNMYEI